MAVVVKPQTQLHAPQFSGAAKVSTASVSAGANIVIPENVQAVIITNDNASAANNLIMPSGKEGQLLFILNQDPAGTKGAFSIPSGKVAQFLYLGGAWRLMGYSITN